MAFQEARRAHPTEVFNYLLRFTDSRPDEVRAARDAVRIVRGVESEARRKWRAWTHSDE